MSDDRNVRGPADRSRINLNEKFEVQYWTRQLGCSEAELRVAVRDAGTSVQAVREYLLRRKR